MIDKENLSNDPDFNMKEEIHPGDEITATVLRLDDGEGNLVLSRKEANDRMAWERLRETDGRLRAISVTVRQNMCSLQAQPGRGRAVTSISI